MMRGQDNGGCGSTDHINFVMASVMRTLKMWPGVVLEEQHVRLFFIWNELDTSEHARHVSVLSMVIRVPCWPLRQDVGKSRAFPIPQDRNWASLSSRPPLVFLVPWRHGVAPPRWLREFGFRMQGPGFIPRDSLRQEAVISCIALVRSVSGDCMLASVCVCQHSWHPSSTDQTLAV